MCKNSIHTTGAAASAVNELCTDRGSVCVTNSESTHDEPLYCRISTQKAIYKIPNQDILSVPLYRILEVLPKETFVQTHRSFIVNLKNASSIDKSQNPWTISFFGSEQLAFVGRSFKDNIMQIIRPTLDLHTGK